MERVDLGRIQEWVLTKWWEERDSENVQERRVSLVGWGNFRGLMLMMRDTQMWDNQCCSAVKAYGD